ncbi:MAG: response regulator [Balneolaceae bacterium]|nr:response regulator [Balneolaceae bacterium]
MRQNILIVEDCSVMRLIIMRTLNLSEIEVGEIYQAENSREGLELLRENKVDLIIVDINMPVMDGAEMLEVLKTDLETKYIPVLTITTESNDKRIELISSMSSNVLHKPFTPEILKREILKLMVN